MMAGTIKLKLKVQEVSIVLILTLLIRGRQEHWSRNLTICILSHELMLLRYNLCISLQGNRWLNTLLCLELMRSHQSQCDQH